MPSEVVIDHAQLAAAIANEEIDTIIFGADIELLDGITIPADRGALIFDGEYEGEIHNFTDIDSSLWERTLHVNAASNISLTFRNMTMTGRNYYGIPCIYETVDTRGVSVYYENINYTGRQFAYNPLGLTHFKDCVINISSSDGQEAGKVCRVEFEGENTISHNSADATKAAFWFTGDIGTPRFSVLEDAKLTVDNSTYFMHAPSLPVEYHIHENASFTLNSHHGISRSLSHQASTFLVDNGASFRYIQQAANAAYSSLYVNESFTVNEGASVYMQADFESAAPFIYFPVGGGSLNINNPKSFVMYNSSSQPLEVIVLVSTNYTITAEQLNYWSTPRALPEAGGFDDIPQRYWHNPDWAAFTMYGVVQWLTTSVFSSGLDNPQFPIGDFNFQNARVISAGNLLIKPDPIIDNGRPITGLTEPDAKLVIRFTVGGIPYEFEDVEVGADGRFELDTTIPLPIGTVVSMSVNTPFLIKAIETTVVSEGEIIIQEAAEKIAFSIPTVALNPPLLRRSSSAAPVVVRDTRPYPTQWRILASISGPLTAASGEVLENAVVCRDDNDTLRELGDVPIAVYSGDAVTGTTEVNWQEDRGLLVRLTEPIRSGVEYTTRLGWALEIIDEP